MKKNYTVNLIFLLLLSTLIGIGCGNGNNKGYSAGHQHKGLQQYTCPMHPEVVKDAPGKCPICGMDLVPKQTATHGAAVNTNLVELLKPVNEQVMAAIPTIHPQSGTRIHSIEVQGSITYDSRHNSSIASRVSGRIERLLIKYNYQPVTKGQLIMEIYSPDLAAAQREMIFISEKTGNADLLQKARQRLLLLGMQSGQIQQVLKTGRILYRVPVYSPASGYILEKSVAATPSAAISTTSTAGGDAMGGMSGGNTAPTGGQTSATTSVQTSPVLLREGQYVNAGQSLFNIYSNTALVAEFSLNPILAAQVKQGQKLVFRKNADPQDVYTGTIGLIQPTFRAGSNFTLARVYLNDNRFQIGQLITANIPIVNRGWWLPESAVLQLGSQSIVFKKEGAVFVPKAVPAGIRIKGMVQIMDSVGQWTVAKSAAYLVDSESFIKFNSTTQIEQP